MAYQIETTCICGDPETSKNHSFGAVSVPIYQTATFAHPGIGESTGHNYTRESNPTRDELEKTVSALEGAVDTVACTSGMAAISLMMELFDSGSHFVCTEDLYGGSVRIFEALEKKRGFSFSYVNTADVEAVEKAITDQTKALYIETPSNPTMQVTDLAEMSRLATKHGLLLIVDNTFATPINCRPFEFGVDIVTHSTTKYMDGHAMALGGAIVDSGNFDWDAHADKFPGLTTPDESYHGVIYTQKFGKKAYITKATAQLMRDMGACQSPQNAFLTNVGLETLHLRVERHCRNAEKVAEFLKNHPKVAWVEYAGLADSKYHALAEKYMPNGTCGVLCFGPKGGRDGAMRFTNGLKMVAIVTHVADARSCVLHPASHTHRQLNDQQLIEAGVLPDLIRLSVGIEDVNDIIADLDQALANV